jgi:hypothetical protein
MNRSKTSKRSRPPAKRRRVKKVAVESANSDTNTSHINTSHINTYGHWVSEMSKMIRERKHAAGPSFKRPSL